MSARPAMAPVTNIVSHLLNTIAMEAQGIDLESLKNLTTSEADKIVKNSQQAIVKITQYGAKLISDDDKIMTHSYSATVIAVLKEAFSRQGNVEPNRLPPGVRIRNPYFDNTPPELTSGIVTEKGLLTAEDVIAYIKEQSADHV